VLGAVLRRRGRCWRPLKYMANIDKSNKYARILRRWDGGLVDLNESSGGFVWFNQKGDRAMKRALQILVPAAFAVLATNASGQIAPPVPKGAPPLVKAGEGRTYQAIRDCLLGARLNLVENEDFRMRPGGTDARGRIQFRGGFWDDPFMQQNRATIDRCITG